VDRKLCFVNSVIVRIDVEILGSAEVGFLQIGPEKNCPEEIGAAEIHFFHVACAKIGFV
jgi:hypothetical protein